MLKKESGTFFTLPPGFGKVLTVVAFFACLQLLAIFRPENPVSRFVREHIESRTIDLRFRLRGAEPAPDNFVIVAIDEKSLAAQGRWPWPRKTVARLVDGIAAGLPRVIGLDLFFPEPESEDADRTLGEAIGRAGTVVMAAAFVRSGDSGSGAQERGASETVPFWFEDAAFPMVSHRKEAREVLFRAGAVLPTRDLIAEGALSHGHAVAELDDDAMVRKELLAIAYGEDIFPAFSLRVAAVAAGVADLAYDGRAGVVFGDRTIGTDPNGRVPIDYYGPTGTFRHVSAADVLSGTAPSAVFAGKIVFVGATGIQTYDPAPSPFDARLPGVEKNATVTANILADTFLKRGYGFVELGVIGLGGLLLSFVLLRVRAVIGTAFAASLVVLYLVATLFAFVQFRYVLGVVYPVTALLFVYGSATVTRYVAEERKAREIRSLFQNYVSPKIVAELLKDPERIHVGGDRREITVLFSDVQGFTTFSERNEPETVVERLNEVLGAMTEIIFSWDGTLDKFVGDEIMAFWGAPLPQADQAERAVACALEMQWRLDELAAAWRGQGREVLRMGIGVNCGEAVVGNIGVQGKKMDYTLIGDTVNTGARIESLTRKFATDLLIAESVVERVRTSASPLAAGLKFEELGTAPVKGKSGELKVYGVSAARAGGLRLHEPPTETREKGT